MSVRRDSRDTSSPEGGWPEHLVHENSYRGFARLPPIPSAYGGDASVYESSAVEPHVWLKVQCPSDLNDPASEPVEAVAHLTLENALRVAQQLHWMVLRHHSKNEEWQQALDHYFPLRWSTDLTPEGPPPTAGEEVAP